MNRREALASLVSATAAAGATGATVKAIESTPARKAALFVIEAPGRISVEVAERIRADINAVMDQTPFNGCSVIVLGDGMKLRVLDEFGADLATEVAPVKDA